MKNGPVCGIYHRVRFLISLEKCRISSPRNAALSRGWRKSFGGGKHSSLSKAVLVGRIPEQSLWYSEILPGFKLLFPTRCLLVSPVFHGSHLTWLLSWPTDPNSPMVLQRTPNPFSLFSRTCRYNEIGFDVEITFATAGFLRSLSGIQMWTRGYAQQGCKAED